MLTVFYTEFRYSDCPNAKFTLQSVVMLRCGYVGSTQAAQSMTKILSVTIMNLVTPKAGAERELSGS
jgi:hypothetical protein